MNEISDNILFKSSCVGQVIQEWSLVPLKDCVQKFHQGINTAADKIEYTQTGVAVLQAKHITTGSIDFTGVRRLNRMDYVRYKEKFNPHQDDILLTNIGTIGKTAIVLTDSEFLIAWNIFLISTNEKAISRYLKFILECLDEQRYYRTLSNGNATKFVNKASLERICIPLPNLKEQQKIVDILTSVDRVIEKTEHQISKLQKLKKGVVNDLLTGGVGHTQFKNSQVGRIPRHWCVFPLKSVTKMMINGFVGTASPHYVSEGIAYVRSLNIRPNLIDTRNLIYVSEGFHRRNERSILKEGDLLTVQSGHTGTSSVVPKSLENANCHAVILSRFDSDRVQSEFVSQYLNSDLGKVRLKQICVGSVIQHINTKDFKDFYIPIPPISEQKKINNILISIENNIKKKQQKLRQAKNLKKSMMQELLTGRVRVKVS